MTGLTFDGTKDFAENMMAFRAHLEGVDAECAAILFAHIDILQREGDQARNRSNRTEFNKNVATDLDALATTGKGS
jgi:hypothetical protein